MKTSNKLLLTGLLALIASSFISMLVAKSNMTITESIPESSTPGEMIIHEVSENLLSDTLVLRDDSKYILDPNSTSFNVSLASNYKDFYTFQDNGTAEVRINNQEINNDITVHLGIKGKTRLHIIANDHSSLKSESEINLNSLTLEADDNTKVNLSLVVDSLSLNLSDYTELYIEGSTKQLDIRGEDHVTLLGKNLTTDMFFASLEDNATIYLDKAETISGTLENESKVFTDKAWVTAFFKLYNNAGVYNSGE
jgi:hypothetical protein